MNPNDKITFFDFHRPGLRAGDYAVDAVQTVQHSASEVDAGRETPIVSRASARFSVAGERYGLDRALIQSVWPPPDSHGPYHRELPHLALRRGTLPWERSPSRREVANPPPWLVLLVFVGDERPTLIRKKLRAWKTEPDWWNPPDEVLDDPDLAVDMIRVPRDRLEALLPTFAELPITAHVRNTEEAALQESSFLLGNRLVADGADAEIHLISLEGRYDEAGRLIGPVDPAAPILLCSLYHWKFHCDGAAKSVLQRALDLDGVDAGRAAELRLPADVTHHPLAEAWLREGYVPLRHTLRTGEQTVSWYRGPFVPRLPHHAETRLDALPATDADALYLFHPDIGMLDASYAVAWQLGRLLALADADYSLALYQWKRAHRLEMTRLRQFLDRDYLSLHDTEVQDLDLPPKVHDWLASLSLLKGIPFSHLVPDERMLPAVGEGSIRFFEVDPTWIACLRDGALAIGRVLRVDHALDQEHADRLPVPPRLSGVLIRAGLLKDHPELILQAWQVDPQAYEAAGPAKTLADVLDAESHLDGIVGIQPMTVVRWERLSPDLFLALFESDGDKVVNLLELRVPPTAIHFGFEQHPDGRLYKQLRNPADGEGLIWTSAAQDAGPGSVLLSVTLKQDLQKSGLSATDQERVRRQLPVGPQPEKPRNIRFFSTLDEKNPSHARSAQSLFQDAVRTWKLDDPQAQQKLDAVTEKGWSETLLVEPAHWRSTAGVLHLEALYTDLGKKLHRNGLATNVADFALQMVHAAPLLRLYRRSA